MAEPLTINARTLPDGLPFTVRGRDAWALSELVKAGPRGCTPIENPGPRWSGYVFNLKRNYGLAIETLHEPHGGTFAGTHGRYVLHSSVEILTETEPPDTKTLQDA